MSSRTVCHTLSFLQVLYDVQQISSDSSQQKNAGARGALFFPGDCETRRPDAPCHTVLYVKTLPFTRRRYSQVASLCSTLSREERERERERESIICILGAASMHTSNLAAASSTSVCHRIHPRPRRTTASTTHRRFSCCSRPRGIVAPPMATSSSSTGGESAHGEDQQPRVLIAGAGVIGSSIAYHLALKGVQATIYDQVGVGCAASGKAGGFLGREMRANGRNCKYTSCKKSSVCFFF